MSLIHSLTAFIVRLLGMELTELHGIGCLCSGVMSSAIFSLAILH